MVVVMVRTLVGEGIEVEFGAGVRGTVADVAEAIEERLHLAQREQMYVAAGRRLEPNDALVANDEGIVTIHLVRRPDPGRSISVHLRLAGAPRARGVLSVRADATVCQVQAAALASLRETHVAIPGGALRLMLGGKVLDGTTGLIAAEFGLVDGCTLFAVPSRQSRNGVGRSFSVQVKIPGVPAVRVNADSGWCVRELKHALRTEISERWDGSSALCRRCNAIELSTSEVHLSRAQSNTSPDHSPRRLSDEDAVPPPEQGDVFFVLPSEQSLDAGARLLLGSVVPQQDTGSSQPRDARIRSALLESARAELGLQLAAQTAQMDVKTVNGKRRQRSVKRSYLRKGVFGCRGQAHRRVETAPAPPARVHSS